MLDYDSLVDTWLRDSPDTVVMSKAEKIAVMKLEDFEGRPVVRDGKLFNCQIITPPNLTDGHMTFFRNGVSS